MSMARLVITAVVVEGRTKSEVARDYGMSRVWVQKLVHATRLRARRRSSRGRGGRMPARRRSAWRSRTRSSRLRKELTEDGHGRRRGDHRWHLAHRRDGSPVPAVSTIWRILSRAGSSPRSRTNGPRSSWRRFGADQPNERWQADITHWRLADGTEVEILNILDDHSRSASGLHSPADLHRPPGRGSTFRAAFGRWGPPAQVLTDNGAVFTGDNAATAGSPWRSQLRPARHPGSATPGPTTPRPAAKSNGSTRP